MIRLLRVAAAAPPALMAGLVFLSAGSIARAEGALPSAAGNVNLASEAVSVQSVYQSLNVPFGLPFAVASYGAAANVEAAGSTANAGAPYSPLVSSLPGAANGVGSSTGYHPPGLPEIPGFVSARYPDSPTGAQSAGMYDLAASAGESEAEGRVNIGGQNSVNRQRNNLFAFARTVGSDTGALAVYGSAGAVALSLPGILDVLNVSSEATLSRAAGDPKPTYTAATNLGTITLAGLTTGVTGSAPEVAGTQQTPINAKTIPGLNQALVPSGVSLSYLPQSFVYTDGSSSTGTDPQAKKAIRGLTTGALRISIANDVPGQGPTTEAITIGRVTVSAAGEEGALSSTGRGTGGATGVDSAGGLPGAGSGIGVDSAAASGLTPGGGDVSSGLDAGSVPTVDRLPLASDAGSVPTVDLLPLASVARGNLSGPGPVDFSIEGLFPFVALVGFAALAGSFLTRWLAVRLLPFRRR